MKCSGMSMCVVLCATSGRKLPSSRMPISPRMAMGCPSRRCNTGRSCSSTLGSSMVEGVVTSLPSAMSRIVRRRIFPERVFGRRSTTTAVLNEATGPIRSRTSWTASATISAAPRSTPALRTSSPTGSCPLSWSAAPITAHSATSGCEARTSSIAPVESLCPATLMMSSVRAITKT